MSDLLKRLIREACDEGYRYAGLECDSEGEERFEEIKRLAFEELDKLTVALSDMTASRDTWKARANKLADDLSAALEGHD